MTSPPAALAALLPLAPAADWPQWRGPMRDGYVPDFPCPAVWPRKLRLQWSVDVGEGHSSPLLVGNRIYVLVRRSEKECTLCLSAETGRVLWEDWQEAPFEVSLIPAQRLGKAPRSTPLYQDGRLYILGIQGRMTCYEAKSGAFLWRRGFESLFTVPMPLCGTALSPLIYKNSIFLHVGHDNEGMFLALDKASGRQRWAWHGEGPAYGSPVLATIDGVRQLVTVAHDSWIALHPETGQLLWKQRIRQGLFDHNSITPAVAGATLICGANQRPTFALTARRGRGRWETVKRWETREVTLATSSPLVAGNRVYAVREKRRGQIVCLALDSGAILWMCPGRKGDHVTLYDAGPHVLAFCLDGTLFIYRKTAAGLEEAARYEVSSDEVWASPAVSGNRLLVKGVRTLTMWEIPAGYPALRNAQT